MKAEDKAKELIERFMPLVHLGGESNLSEDQRELDNAKQCALISIKDQINYIEEEMIGFDYNLRKVYIEELEEVKQHIEKHK